MRVARLGPRGKSAGLLTVVTGLAMGCSNGRSVAEDRAPSYTDPRDVAIDSSAPPVSLHFTDITTAAGIDFVHETGAAGQKWMPETMGSGGGFLDYDADGWPDIFLVNGSRWPGESGERPPSTPRLYRNLGGGRFSDVTNAAGLEFSIYGMGAAFADYDADGDVDIYLTALGDNKLLRNDGGRFTDVTARAGVHGNSGRRGDPPAWSTAASWVDVDRDGWLDLFVCNYVKWTPETDLFVTLDGTNKSYATPQQYEGESCRLYRNLGDGRFTDITQRAGVFNPKGKSLGIAVADFNDDGWPDIFVANDTYQNFLYLNDGDGTFTDVALAAGVAYDEFGRARAGMGVDVADITGEGRLSIVIGNFSREPLSLFTQIGSDGLFQDLAGRARLTGASLLPLTFGLVFADMDLDGYTDLIALNGHIEPDINTVQRDITFAQPPQLFRNTGSGRFTDMSGRVGDAFAEPIVGRGVATADIDRDGDLDILMTVNGGSAKLLRNDLAAPSNGWVGLRLKGRHPNLNAIGAVVTVYAGEIVQRQMVKTGSSYLSQSQLSVLIFGLADAARADSIAVRWPASGKVERFGPVVGGREYVIEEGGGGMTAVSAPRVPH